MARKYLGIQRLYDLQTVANTDHVTKHSMPFAMGEGLVPIIRKIAFSVGFSVGNINGLAEGEYVEHGCSLSSKPTWTGFGDTGEDCVVGNYAELHIKYGAAVGDKSGSSIAHHHGMIEQYFPEGLAYPFDEIYIKTKTVGCANPEWSAARIYYTMEKMSANDILVAREELS